jgi:hypothetical protein
LIQTEWIAPSEDLNDIEEGEEKAALYVTAYLKHAANVDLPRLTWKKALSR